MAMAEGIDAAIKSPETAANANGLPASVTITRSTAGETKITLMNTDNDGVANVFDAFDPKYYGGDGHDRSGDHRVGRSDTDA